MKKLTIGAIVLAVLAVAGALIAQNTAIYFDQGGAKQHIGSGGTLVIDSGGTLDVSAGTVTGAVGVANVTAVASELNVLHGAATNATFAIAQGTTNTTQITITVKTAAGAAIAYPGLVHVLWSGASTGAGVAAASSGAWTATTGIVVKELTSKQSQLCQTNATGVLVLTILDTGKGTNYIVVYTDHSAAPSISRILATGDYG